MSKALNLLQRLALLVFLWTLQLVWLTGTSSAAELLPPGFRPLPLGVHALVGGTLVIKPGEVLEGGTLVIRDGFIKAVGKGIEPPPDARVWDMKGTTIYAGFIEPYLVLGATNPPVSTSDTEPVSTASFTSPGVKFFGAPGVQTDMGSPGPGYEIARITPEYRAVRDYSPKDKTLAPLRELGFTAARDCAGQRHHSRHQRPGRAVRRRTRTTVILKPDVFQHIDFETHSGDERAYPGSLMGVIASVRQSFFDARHYALDHADYQKHPQGRKRPEFDPALEALAPAANRKMRGRLRTRQRPDGGPSRPVWRASLDSTSASSPAVRNGAGPTWPKPRGATFIVPLDFPTLPKLPDEDDWEQVKLDQLRAWDWAPENPALLRQQGRDVALTTYGLTRQEEVPPESAPGPGPRPLGNRRPGRPDDRARADCAAWKTSSAPSKPASWPT